MRIPNIVEKLRIYAPKQLWGNAITSIDIDSEGRMWAHNDEYATQINYCPFTGKPAPSQMKPLTNGINTEKIEYICYWKNLKDEDGLE